MKKKNHAQDMRTYRVDRMKKVKVLEEERDGAAAFKEIDVETYMTSI
jgi:predicted DNA-binding transcriptional regulator YafY